MTATVACNGWENNNKLVQGWHAWFTTRSKWQYLKTPKIFLGWHFFFGSTLSSGLQSDPALSLSSFS